MSAQTPSQINIHSSHFEDGVAYVDFNYVGSGGSPLMYIRQFQSGSWVRISKPAGDLPTVTFSTIGTHTISTNAPNP